MSIFGDDGAGAAADDYVDGGDDGDRRGGAAAATFAGVLFILKAVLSPSTKELKPHTRRNDRPIPSLIEPSPSYPM